MHPRDRLTYESYSNTFPSTIRFEFDSLLNETSFKNKNSKSLKHLRKKETWKDVMYIFTKIIIHEIVKISNCDSE